MCGLVGLISKNKFGFTRDQQDVFSTLLFVDLLRGADSTGTFVVSNNGDVMVAKDAVHSLDFMGTKEYDESLNRAFKDGMAMIGHNRKATRGNITDVNAHPFNVNNNIILVHNGTMVDDHKDFANVEVDSHAIAHLIEEKKDVGEALSSFYGAYALIWYDVENATINMVRNSQRPLWWMETSNSWIWASTPDMLEFARVRHDLKVLEGPAELPENVHQQYKLLDNRDWEVSNETIEIKRKPVVTYTNNSNWPYQHGGAGRRGRFPGEEYDDYYSEYVRNQYGADDTTPTRTDYRPQQQQHTHGKVLELLPGPRKPQESSIGASFNEPLEFAGTHQRERELARESNNLIPYGEYSKRLISGNAFRWGDPVHVIPFDYTYVNGRDSSDGFYLYSTPIDGDSVMLRRYFSNSAVTEERMLQLASNGYIFEMTCGTKGWTPMHPGINFRDDEAGFVIIRATGAKMLHKPADKENLH